MKKRMSGKKKVLLIVMGIVLFLLIVAGITVYAITHSFYKTSN